MIAAPPKDPRHPELGGVDPEEVQSYFEQSLEYTAGVATRYPAGLLIGGPEHQALATGYPIGKRFHSAPVIRIADAKRLELGHVHRADGAWRLYAFADRSEDRLRRLADWLASADSAIRRCTPEGRDPDAVVDVRAIYQRPHREIGLGELPSAFLPRKGQHGLVDYEKAFAPDLRHGPDLFDARGIDRESGAIVLVRPDQYVAHVLPLDATTALGEFLERFMTVRPQAA